MYIQLLVRFQCSFSLGSATAGTAINYIDLLRASQVIIDKIFILAWKPYFLINNFVLTKSTFHEKHTKYEIFRENHGKKVKIPGFE